MAQKKFLDLDGLLYFYNKLKSIFDTKVDKVEGKGLSTNDLTDELKQKILDAGDSSFSGNYDDLLNKPKINNVEVKGQLTLDQLGIQAKGDYTLKTYVDAEVSKKANITHTHTKADITDMPTKVSQFTNDSGFQTASQVTTSINEALKGVTQIDFQVVESLPSSGAKGVIYLVTNAGSGSNIYDEYIWVGNKFESLGKREVDLSGYLKITDLVAITNSEIDNVVI